MKTTSSPLPTNREREDAKRSTTNRPISPSSVYPESSVSYPHPSSSSLLAFRPDFGHNTSKSPSPPRNRIRVNSLTNGAEERILVDPYLILQLQKDASTAQIVQSYKRLSLLNHPHRHYTFVSRPITVTAESETQNSTGWYGTSEKCHDENDEEKLLKTLKDWSFVALAASYETLLNVKHRQRYDALCAVHDEARLRNEESQPNSELDFLPSWSMGSQTRNPNQSSRYSNPSRRDGNDTDKDASAENSDNEEETESMIIREETNQLFGGPLRVLYKARNHQPFTDAFALFQHNFGSNIFHNCIDEDSDDDYAISDCIQYPLTGSLEESRKKSILPMHANHLQTSVSTKPPKHQQKRPVPQNPSSKLPTAYPILPPIPFDVLKRHGLVRYDSNDFVGNSKLDFPIDSTVIDIQQDGGMQILKKSRIRNRSLVIRTERTLTNPYTGRKKTIIEVQRELLGIDDLMKLQSSSDGDKSVFSCSSFVCCVDDGSYVEPGSIVPEAAKMPFSSPSHCKSEPEREFLKTGIPKSVMKGILFDMDESRQERNSSRLFDLCW